MADEMSVSGIYVKWDLSEERVVTNSNVVSRMPSAIVKFSLSHLALVQPWLSYPAPLAAWPGVKESSRRQNQRDIMCQIGIVQNYRG